MINKNKYGFILFEIMVSLVIIGIVLIICIQSISAVVKANVFSYNLTIAATLGQTLFAKIQQDEFEPGYHEGFFNENNKKFLWRIKVILENEFEKKYICSVVWRQGGVEKSFDFTTARFKKPEE